VAINKSIEEKTFHNKPNLVKMFSRAKDGNGRVHFLGLVSSVSCNQVVVCIMCHVFKYIGYCIVFVSTRLVMAVYTVISITCLHYWRLPSNMLFLIVLCTSLPMAETPHQPVEVSTSSKHTYVKYLGVIKN